MRPGINRVVAFYLVCFSVSMFGVGLIAPFIAVFALNQVVGGNTQVAGFAIGIYWITSGLTQIPGGICLDWLRLKFRDADFYFFILHLLVDAIAFFIFLIVYLPWHLYLLQGIRAFSLAFTGASSRVIFSKYLDRGKEGTEWAMQGASFSLPFGIAGIVAGVTIAQFGFATLFIMAGSIQFIAIFISFLMYMESKRKRTPKTL